MSTNNKRKFYGKKRPNVRRDREDKYDSKREESTNDPKWYAADESLLRDSASIPYSWAVGTEIKLNNRYLVDTVESIDSTCVPGVQVQYVHPIVPKTTDASDALNIASSAVYAFVRHANSGHANYDSPDLMLYLLSMSEIYSYITFVQRVYGTALLYSQRNRYMNRVLLEAMNVDATDVSNNLASLRYGINVLINKAASFAVPANMTLFNRRAFMYQNLYTEGESVKDQLYLYSPECFYKYSLNTDGSGMLAPVQWRKTDVSSGEEHLYTVEEMLDFGNSLLQVIMYSEDLNIMSGDILKAYRDSIIKLVSLPTDYTTLPVHDIGALEQMKNAVVIGDCFNGLTIDPTAARIVQDPTHGFLQCTPTVKFTAVSGDTATLSGRKADGMNMLKSNMILTTESVEGTPEVTIENTRLMVVGDKLTGTGTSQTLTLDCCTEIIVACHYYSFHTEWGTGGAVWTPYFEESAYYSMIDGSSTDNLTLQMLKIPVLSNFKYHPRTAHAVSETNAISYTGFIFDVDNYAVLDPQDIKRLHEASIMNMLHVPSISKL